MTYAAASEDFRIGQALNRTWHIIRRNAVMFTVVTVAAMLPLLAINLHFGVAGFFKTDTLENDILTGAVQLVGFICPCFMLAALVTATNEDINGHKPELKKVFIAGFVHLLPVIAISIGYWLWFSLGMLVFHFLPAVEGAPLYWLFYALGLVTLTLPGLALFAVWYVAISARIVEGTSLAGSFRRSAALTRGHRWKIFALVFGSLIITNLLASSAAPADDFNLFPNESGTNSILYIVLIWAVPASMSLVSAVAGTVTYYELRTIKEGATPDQLATAFD